MVHMQVLSNVLWVSHAMVCMKKQQTVWRTVNAYIVNLFKEKTLNHFSKAKFISSFSDVQ